MLSLNLNLHRLCANRIRAGHQDDFAFIREHAELVNVDAMPVENHDDAIHYVAGPTAQCHNPGDMVARKTKELDSAGQKPCELTRTEHIS